MANNRKRKKKPSHDNCSNSFKNFTKDLHAMASQMNYELPDYKLDDLKLVYLKRFQIRTPEAINKLITRKDIQLINKQIRENILIKRIKHHDQVYSIKDIFKFYSISQLVTQHIKRHPEENSDYEIFKDLENKMLKASYTQFLVSTFALMTRLSNPKVKFYNIHVRIGTPVKDDLRYEIVIEVSGHHCQVKHFCINNNYRPTYRLGKITNKGFEWTSVKSSNLSNTQQTKIDEDYPLYIQSHAFNRLSNRLDLLSSEGINHLIWENTCTIKTTIFYKQRTLLPVFLYEIKVGYFVLDLIDSNIIIKTFLFLTHNSTPEGDMLKKISGLGKHDISYWKIDRLSTFVNTNTEQFEALNKLFKQADLNEISQLKDKTFDIESIQTANLKKFEEYIAKGKLFKTTNAS